MKDLERIIKITDQWSKSSCTQEQAILWKARTFAGGKQPGWGSPAGGEFNHTLSSLWAPLLISCRCPCYLNPCKSPKSRGSFEITYINSASQSKKKGWKGKAESGRQTRSQHRRQAITVLSVTFKDNNGQAIEPCPLCHKNFPSQASLIPQWWRICLPVQGT